MMDQAYQPFKDNSLLPSKANTLFKMMAVVAVPYVIYSH